MFNTDDRRRIYWLIDKYLSGAIDTKTFDDEYYRCFDLGVDSDKLSDYEMESLCELRDVVKFFSPYESVHQKVPGLYTTAEEVRQKAAEVKRKLADYWPDELKE